MLPELKRESPSSGPPTGGYGDPSAFSRLAGEARKMCTLLVVLASLVWAPTAGAQAAKDADFDGSGKVDLAYDPEGPNRVYAATLDSPGPVTGDYPSSVGGVYRSLDGGETWSRSNCGLTNSRITSIAVVRNDPTVILIGVSAGEASFIDLMGQFFEGGVYRSDDPGDNWTKVDLVKEDETNAYWRIATVDSGGALVFGFKSDSLAVNVGFARSTDGGETWTTTADTVRQRLVTTYGVSADGRLIYANERDSFALWKSSDGGESWTKSGTNQANGPVAVSPADSRTEVYAGSSRIYRSIDGAESFKQVHEAASMVTDIVFAVDSVRMSVHTPRTKLAEKC